MIFRENVIKGSNILTVGFLSKNEFEKLLDKTNFKNTHEFLQSLEDNKWDISKVLGFKAPELPEDIFNEFSLPITWKNKRCSLLDMCFGSKELEESKFSNRINFEIRLTNEKYRKHCFKVEFEKHNQFYGGYGYDSSPAYHWTSEEEKALEPIKDDQTIFDYIIKIYDTFKSHINKNEQKKIR